MTTTITNKLAEETYRLLPATSKELQDELGISADCVKSRIAAMRRFGFEIETQGHTYMPIQAGTKVVVLNQTFAAEKYKKVSVIFPDMAQPMGLSMEEYHKTQKYIIDNGGKVIIGDKRVEAFQPEIGL